MAENIKFNSNIEVEGTINNTLKVIEGTDIYRFSFVIPSASGASLWDGCNFTFDFECYMDISGYGKINLSRFYSATGGITIYTGKFDDDGQEEIVYLSYDEDEIYNYVYTSDVSSALGWTGFVDYTQEKATLILDEPAGTIHPSIQLGDTIYSETNLVVKDRNNVSLGSGSNYNANDINSLKIGNAPCAAHNSLLVGNNILGSMNYDDSGNLIPSNTPMINSIVAGTAPSIPYDVQTGLFFGDGFSDSWGIYPANLFAAYTQDYQRKYQFGNVTFTEQQLQFLNTLNAAKLGPQEIMTLSCSYDSPSWTECMGGSGDKTSGWYTEITQSVFNQLKTAEKVKLVPSDSHPAFYGEGTAYRSTHFVTVFEAITDYVGYHPDISAMGADFTVFAGKIDSEEKKYAIVVSDAIWEQFGAPVYNQGPAHMMDLIFYK